MNIKQELGNLVDYRKQSQRKAQSRVLGKVYVIS